MKGWNWGTVRFGGESWQGGSSPAVPLIGEGAARGRPSQLEVVGLGVSGGWSSVPSHQGACSCSS